MTVKAALRPAIACLILLAAGTAVAQDVRYNFDKGADFSKFKTYKWVPIKDAAKVDDLHHIGRPARPACVDLQISALS